MTKSRNKSKEEISGSQQDFVIKGVVDKGQSKQPSQAEVSLRMRANLMERAMERLERLVQAVRLADKIAADSDEYENVMSEMYEALESAETFLGLR